ncbi:MAG: hypothetical protein CFE44_00585 [Burkholderiales bacterium PBB4]|nr:MAG: hypothetical protein CFE44_00585 [Burkholderiales bacterium PBB4]
MSLEIGLPTALGSANGGKAAGRQSGLTMFAEADSADVGGGFGAILARAQDGGNAVEESDGDRRRKPADTDVSQTPDAPMPSVASAEMMLVEATAAVSADSGRTSMEAARLSSDVALQGSSVDLGLDETNPGAAGTALGHILGGKAGGVSAGAQAALGLVLAKVGADVAESQPFSRDSLQAVAVEVPLDIASSTSPDASAVATASMRQSSAALQLEANVSVPTNVSKGRGDRDVKSKADLRGAGVISSSAMESGRVEDSSARARVAQEFKLFAQQASFSRDLAIIPPLESEEKGVRSSDKGVENKGVALLESRVVGGDSSADPTWVADAVGFLSSDGVATTGQDNDQASALWMSGDVSNAKIKLGDATEGVVEVSIRLQGNQAQVTFNSDELTTRNALQDSGHQLKELLRRDGIELSGVSVGFSGAQSGGSGQRQEAESRRMVSVVGQDKKLQTPVATPSGALSNGLDLFV